MNTPVSAHKIFQNDTCIIHPSTDTFTSPSYCIDLAMQMLSRDYSGSIMHSKSSVTDGEYPKWITTYLRLSDQ